MNTHTPGPWVAHCMTLAEAKEEGWFTWMTMGDDEFAKPPDFRVGEVWKVTDNGGTTGLPGSIETTEANAYLIAAAPDLLSALKALGLRFGALVLASGDFSDANAKAIDAANAAIERAEGKGQAA